jgi:hypothetical protein
MTQVNNSEASQNLFQQYTWRKLMPLAQLQQEFQQALDAAGYTDREAIIELVRSVKKEMADERRNQANASDE